MTSVSVSRFRQHLHRFVELVRAGEEVQLLHRGKAVAVLKPPIDAPSRASQALERLRKVARVGDVVTPLSDLWEANDGAP